MKQAAEAPVLSSEEIAPVQTLEEERAAAATAAAEVYVPEPLEAEVISTQEAPELAAQIDAILDRLGDKIVQKVDEAKAETTQSATQIEQNGQPEDVAAAQAAAERYQQGVEDATSELANEMIEAAPSLADRMRGFIDKVSYRATEAVKSVRDKIAIKTLDTFMVSIQNKKVATLKGKIADEELSYRHWKDTAESIDRQIKQETKLMQEGIAKHGVIDHKDRVTFEKKMADLKIDMEHAQDKKVQFGEDFNRLNIELEKIEQKRQEVLSTVVRFASERMNPLWERTAEPRGKIEALSQEMAAFNQDIEAKKSELAAIDADLVKFPMHGTYLDKLRTDAAHELAILEKEFEGRNKKKEKLEKKLSAVEAKLAVWVGIVNTVEQKKREVEATKRPRIVRFKLPVPNTDLNINRDKVTGPYVKEHEQKVEALERKRNTMEFINAWNALFRREMSIDPERVKKGNMYSIQDGFTMKDFIGLAHWYQSEEKKNGRRPMSKNRIKQALDITLGRLKNQD